MAKMIEDPSRPIAYVPESDRGKPFEERSVFSLRRLTVQLQGQLAKQRDKGDTGLLKRHLAGWRNFPVGAEENHLFEISGGEPTSATLDRLPFSLRSELAMAVLADEAEIEAGERYADPDVEPMAIEGQGA